jgi:glutamate carboxypeptidase
MPQSNGNRNLFKIVQDIAKRLNIKVEEEYRSGVSDANLIAARGVPVLDGLGPIGALDHSDKEYMLKSSLVERTQLFALTLAEAWKQYQ